MAKPAWRIDMMAFIFSMAVISLVAIKVAQSDIQLLSLEAGQNWTWYFIRSTGLSAYILLAASTIWGLALSSRIVSNWSPGSLSMLMHSTVSWLAVVFSMVHATLLMFDSYFSYRISDIVVPFIGPYRPIAVGLGTVTFWIILVVSLSFSVKKWLGHRRWKWLHLSSYVGFGLVTAHALLAGTDASKAGYQLLMVLASIMVIGLLSYRIGFYTPKTKQA